jgi:hypothetical protein
MFFVYFIKLCGFNKIELSGSDFHTLYDRLLDRFTFYHHYLRLVQIQINIQSNCNLHEINSLFCSFVET